MVISKSNLKRLVSEVLDNNVNNVVDKMAFITDVSNFDQIPQDKIEFIVAIKTLIDDIPIDKIPDIYKGIKKFIDTNENNMKDKKFETTVRNHVRKLISEAQPLPPVKKIPFGVHGAEYERNAAAQKASLKKSMKRDIDALAKATPELDIDVDPTKKKSAYKSTALGGMADVQGASFEDIANELNFSVAGAKQAVDKALEKAKWLASEIDENDLEILVLRSMNDYIDMLVKTGELTSADVKIMKDHPSIVRELDGFREYLGNVIRKLRKDSKDSLEEHSSRVCEALASVGIKL